MVERPFFFEGARDTLFGILHEPVAGTPRRPPVVFCHAFGEEKLWAHRVFVTFARQLAALGHPVLRFDYTGNGDSGGGFDMFSVEVGVADTTAAIDWLKADAKADAVILLGLRFGATLALLTAGQRPDVASVVLWAPIVDAGKYMQELLRINLTTQMAVYKEIRDDRDALAALLRAGRTVNVDGFEIGLPLFEQMSALKLTTAAPLSVPGLLVQIDRNPQAPPARDLEALRAAHPTLALQLVQEEPFWKEIERFYDTAPHLAATTLAWLQS